MLSDPTRLRILMQLRGSRRSVRQRPRGMDRHQRVGRVARAAAAARATASSNPNGADAGSSTPSPTSTPASCSTPPSRTSKPTTDERPTTTSDDHTPRTRPRPSARVCKGIVAGIFAPHSHDAADSIDTALESSRRGIRAVKISFVALLITAALQLGVIVDLGIDRPRRRHDPQLQRRAHGHPAVHRVPPRPRPPTRRYTYGYGRAEDLAGLFVDLDDHALRDRRRRRSHPPAHLSPRRSTTSASSPPRASSASSATSSSRSTASAKATRSAPPRSSPTATTPAPTASRHSRSWPAPSASGPAIARADAIAGLVISVAILAVLRVAVDRGVPPADERRRPGARRPHRTRSPRMHPASASVQHVTSAMGRPSPAGRPRHHRRHQHATSPTRTTSPTTSNTNSSTTSRTSTPRLFTSNPPVPNATQHTGASDRDAIPNSPSPP